MGISLKKAKYFILCDGKYFASMNILKRNFLESNLILESKEKNERESCQLSLFHE